ncbi:MAG TPA: ABC transporter ATP-binding protein, partial [Planctomycetota bacterium]|nr:ABC transporter ATP-binding protein [Planctomycetota bacterium]
ALGLAEGAAAALSAGGWAALLAPARLLLESFMFLWLNLEPFEQLAAACAFFVLLAMIEQSNKYAQKLIMRSVVLRIVSDIRLALFDRLMSFSMRFYQANHSGRLMSRLTGDLHGLGVLLVDVVIDLATDCFTLIGALLGLYLKGGWLVLAGLALSVVSFVPVQVLARRLRRKESDNQSRLASLFINLSEVFTAQKVVKAFGAEDYEQARFRRVNEQYVSGQMKATDLRARVQPLVDVIGAVGIALLVWLGGLQVVDGNWAVGDLFGVIFLLVQVIGALRRLSDTNTKLHGGLASADRVATVLDSDPEIVDAPDAVALDGFHRGISFREVRYDHDPAHPVLRDVTFELHKGRTLAVVGPTGSGKTTLADLVPRFYDVQGGAVLIDGRDVREIKLASLRALVSVVTQDPVLFRDTLRANIAYARPDTPMEDIVAAAKAAHAHDFIMRLPQGYDTAVGERGLTLSGGERQRVAIARALLKNAPILILDEATSALDSASEQLVQAALANLKAGRTTIVIAHRLSTVRDADVILVLERGRVVETGAHSALMRKGGIYAEMVKIQQA